MKQKIEILFFTLLLSFFSYGQRLVTFSASDGLEVTADYYETYINSSKYMLMFHQAEYSRGEFEQIAKRIIKLDINCLAVDVRYGNEVNYINNETAMKARRGGYSQTMMDCEKDIIAAIDYIRSTDPFAEIYLMGSSFSGSLCLKVAKDRKDVQAVIAYSPGEFFMDFSVENYVKGLQTPTYIGCTRSEYSYVSKISEGIATQRNVLFRPEDTEGEYGAKMLWWESKASEDAWLSLLFFLKDCK